MLDDLHAADEPSLLLLRFVAREIAGARLLVICAHRDVDPAIGDPLSAAVAELVREPHARQIALAGLGERDVARYIERSTGVNSAGVAGRSIAAETEGNPLFVVELVRLLVAERRLDEPDPRLAIPPGVRVVIGRRVARLSPRCRDMLAVASVLGRDFALDAIARIGGFERGELLEALDEAISERVIDEAPRSPGRLRFSARADPRHALRRAPRAAQARAPSRGGRGARGHLRRRPRAARRRAGAALPGAPAATEKAVEYARRAGDRAVSQLAYEEAVRHYDSALALVDEPVPRCELLLALGDAYDRAGDTRASRAAYREAADVAERVGLSGHLARAAIGYGGRILWELGRDDERASLLERALAALPACDSPLRAQLLARLAMRLRGTPGAIERMLALACEALEMAERLRDVETLIYVA